MGIPFLGEHKKLTPLSLISEIKKFPMLSSQTLPQKEELPPKRLIPVMVLATDPPELFFTELNFLKM